MKLRMAGLTGNIGCGKSTVSRLLAKFADVAVYDTDHIWKEMLHEDAERDFVRVLVGERAYVDSKPQFAVIAAVIFADDEKRGVLEAFAGSRLVVELMRRMRLQPDKMHVIENAIWFESGMANFFPEPPEIIIATCPPEEQMRRVLARPIDGRPSLTREQFEARERLQWPQEKKVALANHVIDTHCSLPELESRVKELHDQLMGGSHE